MNLRGHVLYDGERRRRNNTVVKKNRIGSRVSEPACFGAAPAPAPGKREHDFGIFLKTDYKVSL